MTADEQARFDQLYQQQLIALKLQGKRPKTIDAYTRGLRHLCNHYGRSPDTLSNDELKGYFFRLLETHSWSTIKHDCYLGLRLGEALDLQVSNIDARPSAGAYPLGQGRQGSLCAIARLHLAGAASLPEDPSPPEVAVPQRQR